MEWLKIFFNCKLMNNHSWTSAAMEGKEATPEQLALGINGFFDYAKMYCKTCGHESSLNKGWHREEED